MSSREPTARYRHAAVGVGDELLLWGGLNHSTKIKTTTLERFNVSSVTWKISQYLNGSLPESLHNAAVTSDGENLYSFGGYSNTGRVNTLYEINPRTFLCRELLPNSPSPAPPKLEGSRCVYYEKKIVVYGGYTDEGHYSDDLHVFDLEKRMWTTQLTTGEKPPPLAWHTFTNIDHHSAALFGGYTGSRSLSDTYVLDMKTWHWTKLQISGSCPPARNYHDACCIAGPLTGQQYPLLIVVGGVGPEYHGDMWLLDVDKEVWNEVTLPVDITQRYGHSAVVFGSGPSFRVVVMFGGKNPSSQLLSETTLLLLELKGSSWQVTRCVRLDELEGPDESLTEQMGKLEFSPEEGTTSGVEQSLKQSLKEEQLKRAEAERQVQLQKQEVAELQTNSPVTEGAASPAFKDTPTPTTVVKINLSDLHIGDEKLGKGQFGNVFKGHWKTNTVAVKITHLQRSETLPQEIKVWAHLPPHQNIITFFCVALERFTTYIVMEFAANISLCDYLHASKETPSVDQSLIWASHVAHGMKHLHDHDIIHRDLKSPNVLLTDKWVAKLCDFGSALELIHTRTITQSGTYRWMSPEVMKAAKAKINKKCDLFSYGMILYELFDHQIPYSDMSNDVDVLTAAMRGERPRIPPTLPLYLHSLLSRCWNEDPRKRPTFDEFVGMMVLPKTV